MMKSIIYNTLVSVLILSIPMQYARTWGLVEDMPQQKRLVFKLVNHTNIVIPTRLRQVTNTRKTVDPNTGEIIKGYKEFAPIKDRALAQDMLFSTQKALNDWIITTRQTIEKAGRQQEFADLLAALPQQILLQEVTDGQDYQLTLEYDPDTSFHAGAQTTLDNDHHIIRLHKILSKNDARYQVLLHEVGHALGLEDQYGRFAWRKQDTQFHSFFATWDSNNNSVMFASGHGLFADDIDGFINAVDFVLAYQYNQLSPRVQHGWKGFSQPYDSQTVYYAYMIPAGGKNGQIDEEARKRNQQLWNAVAPLRNTLAQLTRLHNLLDSKMANLEKQLTSFSCGNAQKTLSDFSNEHLSLLLKRAELQYWKELNAELTAVSNTHGGKLNQNASVWKNLSQRLQSFVKQHPIETLRTPNPQKLKQTSSGCFLTSARHCAGGGEEVDNRVALRQHKYVNKQNKYVTRYFYLCDHHKRPDLNSENFHKYTFRSPAQAQDASQAVAITYQMAAQELEARQVGNQLKQKLKVPKL